jgi:hypothetical protein
LGGTVLASFLNRQQLDRANRRWLASQRAERIRSAVLKVLQSVETSDNAAAVELYMEGRASLLLEADAESVAERFDELVRGGRRQELVAEARSYVASLEGYDGVERRRRPEPPTAAHAHAARTILMARAKR